MPASSDAAICNMALGYAGVNERINTLDDGTSTAQACKVYYEQYRDDLLNDYRWPFAIRRAILTTNEGPTQAYVSSQVYNLNDLTKFGALVYRSLQAANTGNQPNTSPAWWAQVTRDAYSYSCNMSQVPDFVDAIEVYQKPNVSSTAVPNSFAQQPPPALRNPRSEQRPAYRVEDANDGTGQQILLTDLDSPVLKYTARITNPQSFSGPFTKALAWRLSVALCLALRADMRSAEVLEKKAEKEVRESIATEMRGEREDPEPVSDFESVREG